MAGNKNHGPGRAGSWRMFKAKKWQNHGTKSDQMSSQFRDVQKQNKMSKTKTNGVKAAKPEKGLLNKVKDGGVTKAVQATKAKGKEVAKAVVGTEDKKSKKQKKAKEPTPEPESESESEPESAEEDESSESSDSDNEVGTKLAVNGKSKTNGVTKPTEESDSDESESSEDSDDETPAALPNGAKVADSSDEDDSEEDSDDSEDKKPALPLKKKADDSESEDDSDASDESDEDEAPAKAKGGVPAGELRSIRVTPYRKSNAIPVSGKAKAASKVDAENEDSEEDSDEDSSEEESDEDEEEEKPAAPISKKRKAEEESPFAAKKNKAEASATTEANGTNLFVGNLSWNVDEDWLSKEFGEFGELSGVRIVYDRQTNRSKG